MADSNDVSFNSITAPMESSASITDIPEVEIAAVHQWDNENSVFALSLQGNVAGDSSLPMFYSQTRLTVRDFQN